MRRRGRTARRADRRNGGQRFGHRVRRAAERGAGIARGAGRTGAGRRSGHSGILVPMCIEWVDFGWGEGRGAAGMDKW